MGNSFAPKISAADSVESEGNAESGLPFAERLTCSIADACIATGLGKTKLYELIAQHAITTKTVGRRRLVLVDSLREFMVSRD